MTTLNIVEFSSIQAYWTEASAQIAKTPPVAIQEMTPSTTSQISTAFSGNTNIVRLSADVPVRLAFSISTAMATANATSLRLTADAPEYFGVEPGQRVAVILG